MTSLLHELPAIAAKRTPSAVAVRYKNESLDYASLTDGIDRFAGALIRLGIERQERVAIFLPKQFETVLSMFGATRAGCVFVPVNPILKAPQVQHILRDCNVRVLVTSADRLTGLQEILPHCPDLRHLILVSGEGTVPSPIEVHQWKAVNAPAESLNAHRVIDTDMAAILYTSGSTGKPKGVVLSHRNMVTGAHSVAQYLENTASDRLLAVLPFSFDYGFSQMSTAFHVGASVVLMDHLFARDVIAAVAREKITGLAAVPPLWSQLADLAWPEFVM